jgi:peptidoglycan/LPS O-acetylase OafA/YrhL
MKTLHLILGVLVVLAFLLTGQFMEYRHVGEMDDGARMMFRSRHIYVLLAGLVNLGIGIYFTYRQERWRKILQLIGSLLVVISPLLLIAAFFYEPVLEGMQRTFTLPGIVALFAGVFCHLFSGMRQGKKPTAI